MDTPEMHIPTPLGAGEDQILITGDLEKLAEEMTDKERNALLIQIFRHQQHAASVLAKFESMMAAISAMSPLSIGIPNGGVPKPRTEFTNPRPRKGA